MADAQRQPEEASVLSADSFTDEPIPTLRGDQDMTQRLTPRAFPCSSTAPSQQKTSSEVQEPPKETQMGNQEDDGQTISPDGEGSDPKTDRTPPLTEPSAHIQRLTSLGIAPPSSFSTALSMWGHKGVTTTMLPDSLLPDIGPNLMPREDGPENLWTEAARASNADTVMPLSQDEATEGTMSSEALPLIFEPFDDITQEGVAAPAVARAPGSAQPPAAMATRGMPLSEVDLDQLVTVETDSDGPSHAPPMLIPDWTSTWQTSGAELLEPISPSGLSASQRRAGTNPEGVVRTPNVEAGLSTSGTLSSSQQAMTTDQTYHHSAHKSRSGFVEVESDEEPDEDEEDENSEESLEEESEEDLTETPKPSSTQPPYSLIPPPPVWVQRNPGLMRSWVELIKEKAGYVSGMLAPVGIGITGALLIVGALYSIRMIHRKRRNSFKHQRRKQPREPGVNCQDQAMLLADSSEDEF
ncbi:armadillo-like helical domain-containing protein 4 isoform X2 [Thalassophryne amazonica]|uniref:armadillo-like helical domain-containing protein 4 isoform X2 n=1 Tax=Thalassophryne amazonica TaxID=390379 RepID=UPI001471D3B6|nr:armadillo-like helical domain-containing protein 4 isoform X2 [Thalassophryne amazonica]